MLECYLFAWSIPLPLLHVIYASNTWTCCSTWAYSITGLRQLCDLLCCQKAMPLSYQKTLSGTHGLQGMENLIRVWKGPRGRWQEDGAVIWELKTERGKTHLWQETGERTAHNCQRKQHLKTETQPEASLSSALNRELWKLLNHILLLPNLFPPHTPAAETTTRFIAPNPANDPQGRNGHLCMWCCAMPLLFLLWLAPVTFKFSLLPVKYQTAQKQLGKKADFS